MDTGSRLTVVVTGASGFVGSHAVLRLLRDGYVVRGSLRSLSKEAEVRAMLRAADGGALASVVDDPARFSLFSATLDSPAGWDAAIAGSDYVLHIASPLPAAAPKDPDEIIRPAVSGVLNVLKAACRAGVRRVVLTSSAGAIYYGHPLAPGMKPFDETSWTNLDSRDMSSYVRSKALAEKAAWDYMAQQSTTELTVVNPVGIFGQVLGVTVPSSVQIIERLIKGTPGCPNIYFAVVDVQDVVDLHVKAMLAPEAKGQRFIAASEGENPLSMLDISRILRAHLGPQAGAKLPTRTIPDFVVRVVGLFDARMRSLLPLVSKIRPITSDKAKTVLGWSPKSPAETLNETADSLLRIAAL